MIYADTSFLVSLYLQEENSDVALQYLRHLKRPILVTSWNEIELLTAFSLNVHFKRITESQQKKAVRQWENDLTTGFFQSKPLPEEKVLLHSKQIIQKHHHSAAARSLDIIHIASALALKARDFVTFDKRQLKLAQHCGLRSISF